MVTKVLKLPLYNDISYKYSILLEGSVYTFSFLYLNRLSNWVLSITDSEGNLILSGQQLSVNARIDLQHLKASLSGFLILVPLVSDVATNMVSLKSPKDTYELFYIY